MPEQGLTFLLYPTSWTMVSVSPPLGEKQTERITRQGVGAGGWTGAVTQPTSGTVRNKDRGFIEGDYITSEHPCK